MNEMTHKQPGTLKQWLHTDQLREAVTQALPRHLTPDRFLRVAMTALTRTPKLSECDQKSFFNALLTLSELGLEPDGRRAHLIPFRNNKKGIVECQLIVDYKGLVELIMRSGEVSRIHADVVCEHDVFEYDRGEVKAHKIDFRKPRGEAYAAYALARLKDGTERAEVMSRDDVEAIRKRSKAASSGPWVTDWSEMSKKTVFRRLSKWLPLSAELRRAVEVDDSQFDVMPASRHTQAIAHGQSKADALAGLLAGSDEPEDPEEQEPGQQPPEQLTVDVSQFLRAISKLNQIREVEQCRDDYLDAAESDEDNKRINALADDRIESIRKSRGGKK